MRDPGIGERQYAGEWMMTWAESLMEAKQRLKAAGIADHDTDAFLLLSFLTGVSRTFIYTHGDEEIPGEQYGKYQELINKRLEHIPTQLLTGVQDFMGFEFEVEEGVLIPRLDTEFLVEEALLEITDGAKVLDLCCGSGCIIISVAKLTNNIEAFASDISDEALGLTRRNAEKLGADISLIKSDLFDSIEEKFDFILSNPPYIRSGDIPHLMEEVREHDPHPALDGGEDGLDFYRRIAGTAGERLNGGGMLIMETGSDEGEAVKEIFETAGYKNVELLKDYSGNERVVKCLKSWTT